MDKLWAPWRVKYITKIIKSTKGCVFCRIQAQQKDRDNYVVLRMKHCYCVLNIYPYNNGHLLIVPNRHVNNFKGLRRVEREEMMDLLELSQDLLEEIMKPQGYNIGINLGKVAGAGFPGHLHIHVVPRWKGDVNFMPVTAQTKVISQSLQALYEKLTDAYKKRH